MNSLEKLLDTFSDNELKKISKTITQIDNKYKKYENVDLKSFKNITESFKERYEETGDLDSLLPDAYALVKAAIKKMTGKTMFDSQLQASCVLNDGNIAEMKTGEGKTLALLSSAYLNALTGKGVHIVTSNEYLAERDSAEVRDIFSVLGISVGCAITKDENGEALTGKAQDDKLRREFQKDIVYTTSSALVFSYLKDNSVVDKNDRILRGLNYVILDEIDSSLIDDARNPFILSKSNSNDEIYYREAQAFVQTLKHESFDQSISTFSNSFQIALGEGYLPKNDRHFDSYSSSNDYFADITNEGLDKYYKFLRENPNLEEFKKIKIKETDGTIKEYDMDYEVPEEKLDNVLFDGPNTFLLYVKNALIANYCYKYAKDYEIVDGEIKLVDKNTARKLLDSKLEKGLHQAIEAKEEVRITSENKSLGSITYPSFFKLYDKRSGLSGTAKQAEKEFNNLYGLGVVQIPRNKASRREDLGTDLYKTKQEKYDAIIDQVLFCRKTGQPIVVGVDTVEDCETLNRLFNIYGIKHNSLSARNDFEEAKIIEEAGRMGSVTIVTPMAGRGTDIKLGGTIDSRIFSSDAMHQFALSSIDNEEIDKQSKDLYRSIHINGLKPRNERAKDRAKIKQLEKGEGSSDELRKYQKEVKELKTKMIDEHIIKFLEDCKNKKVSADIFKKYLEIYEKEKIKAEKSQQEEARQVNALGGLFILGTEISRSNRVQEQLIGRSGRNGENGSSKFIVSLEDRFFKDGLRLEKINEYKKAVINKGSKLVQKLVDKIQSNISSADEKTRENQYRLDAIDDKDRTAYYKYRDGILDCNDMETRLNELMFASIDNTVERIIPTSSVTEDELRKIENEYMDVLTTSECFKDTNITKKQLKMFLKTSAKNRLHAYKENEPENFEKLVREKTLNESDEVWYDYVDTTKDRHRIASLKTQSLTEYGSSHGDMFNEYEFISNQSFKEFVEVLMDNVTKGIISDANKYVNLNQDEVQRVSDVNIDANVKRK